MKLPLNLIRPALKILLSSIVALLAVILGAGVGILTFAGVCCISTAFFWACWHFIISPCFHIVDLSFLQCFGIVTLLTLIGGFFKSSK